MREYLRRRRADCNWDKAYTVCIRLPDGRRCRGTLHGYDNPESLLARLRKQGLLLPINRADSWVSGWPRIDFREYPDQGDISAVHTPQFLCEIDPKGDYWISVEDESSNSASTPQVCLYGCPNAAELGYEELPVCNPEVVNYE